MTSKNTPSSEFTPSPPPSTDNFLGVVAPDTHSSSSYYEVTQTTVPPNETEEFFLNDINKITAALTQVTTFLYFELATAILSGYHQSVYSGFWLLLSHQHA